MIDPKDIMKIIKMLYYLFSTSNQLITFLKNMKTDNNGFK